MLLRRVAAGLRALLRRSEGEQDLHEELREYQLSIGERLAAIQTRVETQLQTYMQRLDKAIAKEEAT